MLEKIVHENLELAIIIRHSYQQEGISFFTDEDSSQQLGYMNRPKDYVIEPHRHQIIPRAVHLTQEVLFLKSGRVRVDFYDNEQHYLFSKELFQGDVILLSDGGHGFKMLEQSEMIEVKQGPYNGERDKVRFESVSDHKIKIL